MPAYVETARRSWRETALQCAAFSVGDAVLTWTIYAVAVTAVLPAEVLYVHLCTRALLRPGSLN